MMSSLSSGIITRKSVHSVDETVRRIENVLSAEGIRLFAIIDHSGESERVGFRMPNTRLVIFGHPKAGTPIMLAAPSAAIDLPLKILVAEDSGGTVWITYNSTSYLQVRHGFPQALADGIAGVENLASMAGE